MRNRNVLILTLNALFLALALVLPFLTGQIAQIGSMLLPMHLPVLLCGFVCGWQSGLAVGLIAPILRSLLFGMPPLMPTAIAMSFELAAYGAAAGCLYHALRKNKFRAVVTLAIAMLIGRAVWGLASLVLYSLFLQTPFTLALFMGGAFLRAWPGILAQFVVIPLVVLALERAKLIPLARNGR